MNALMLVISAMIKEIIASQRHGVVARWKIWF
jgi:uncharacterized membrane-anchored protein